MVTHKTVEDRPSASRDRSVSPLAVVAPERSAAARRLRWGIRSSTPQCRISSSPSEAPCSIDRNHSHHFRTIVPVSTAQERSRCSNALSLLAGWRSVGSGAAWNSDPILIGRQRCGGKSRQHAAEDSHMDDQTPAERRSTVTWCATCRDRRGPFVYMQSGRDYCRACSLQIKDVMQLLSAGRRQGDLVLD